MWLCFLIIKALLLKSEIKADVKVSPVYPWEDSDVHKIKTGNPIRKIIMCQ